MTVDLEHLPASQEVPGKRGRKPGSKAKERQDLPADVFVISSAQADERGNYRRERVKRSAQQVAIDNKVLEICRLWRSEGAKKDWNDMPVQLWGPFPHRYLDDVLFMLKKGVARHTKKLVLGKITTEKGMTTIPFCVTDRRTKVENAPEQSE